MTATEQIISASEKNQRPVTFRQLVRALRRLDIPAGKPVVAHSSLRAFGSVLGGSETVAGALIEVFESVVVPTFTYQTLVVPETGPPDNAIQYGTHTDRNKMAEFYYPEMPADRLMGAVAEALRQHPEADRSGHPVLSFAGVNARQFLEQQRLTEPLAPLAVMYDQGGWVLLLGVGHTANTTIHLGERLAGRKMYTRWALMSDIVVTCTNIPYCSDGFDSIQPLMDPFTKKAVIGEAVVHAMPMYELIQTARQLIEADPSALLCDRTDCQSCNTVRRLMIRRKHGMEGDRDG